MTETLKRCGNDLFFGPTFPPPGKYDATLIHQSAGIGILRLAFQRP